VTPIQADAPPAQVDVTPIQADAPPVQADVTLIQADAPQENDDTTQTNNLSDQNPELVSDPVNHEKESLLERAVLKQEELKEKQNNVEVGNNHQETGEENIKTEEIVQDVEKPVDDEILKDEVIVDPYESISGDDVSIEIPAENENILHEMDKHALVVRERTGLLSDSNILGAFGSLVELVGVRNLIKRIVVAGFGIFIVLMAWNILFDQGQPVETTLVETGEIFQSITVPGRVLSKQRVNISSAHTGRTVKILVKEGDKVKAGQVLAKMDDRELISSHNRAKANLTDARESVVLARRTLSRLRKAYKKGAVARQFVEDAELDLSSARSQAGIAVEEAHSAKLQLSKQQVTAPFTGTITARFAEVGQWVGPSESLFTLVDESRREIEVRVDAADSVAIDVGQVVAVSSDAFPGLEWHESVSRLGTAANNDRNSNSVKVYISLGNDAPSLRFGQQVDADIRTAWNPNTLKVPFEALINRDGQTLVAVLSGGQVKLKPVETGIEDFSMVEIKQGLNDGELVILSKGQFLQNGDKAHPVRNSR
jgi:RND family efflux transporter MFP subunit